MVNNKLAWWIVGLSTACGVAAFFGFKMKSNDQTVFLPGDTTHGHYQIEMACSACHTPMMGVKEESCLDCHAADLKAVNDSHPKAKFTDPRNAELVSVLDARNCLTCHKEHVPDRTHAMGLTIPDDYCFLCHEEIGNERPTHEGLTFDTCTTAGCHNYHDNSGLYEDFLSKHLDDDDINHSGAVRERELIAFLKKGGSTFKPLLESDADAPTGKMGSKELLGHWSETAHAAAGVNCSDCHEQDESWSDSLGHESCNSCHSLEVEGFLKGKHGMKLASGLSAMTPGDARLPMKHSSFHEELSCVSCHDDHRFDTRSAAVDSCLRCHDDQHSRAYMESSHYSLWEEEMEGANAGTGVSCATCHMPRIEVSENYVKRTLVQHNQNFNLQPNERMIRTVCANCHGVGFAIDSLADKELIKNNFNKRPSSHIKSMDWVKERALKN